MSSQLLGTKMEDGNNTNSPNFFIRMYLSSNDSFAVFCRWSFGPASSAIPSMCVWTLHQWPLHHQPPQLLRTIRKTINLQFLVDHIDLGWKGWDFCPGQNGPGWWWLEGVGGSGCICACCSCCCCCLKPWRLLPCSLGLINHKRWIQILPVLVPTRKTFLVHLPLDIFGAKHCVLLIGNYV